MGAFYGFLSDNFTLMLFVALALYAVLYFLSQRLERFLVDDQFPLYSTKDDREMLRQLREKERTKPKG